MGRDNVVGLGEVRKSRTFTFVDAMFLELAEEGIELKFTDIQLRCLLDELYQLYETKEIVYQYDENMTSYFSTICQDILESNLSCVLFSDVMQGVIGCYQLMSPVEVERQDMLQVVSKVKKKVKEAKKDVRGKRCY